MTRISTLILLLLAVSAAHAALYRQVDEQGRITYTDVPPSEDAAPVDLPPVNVMPAPPVTPAVDAPRQSAPSQSDTAQGYTQFSISSPANDQTLRANSGQVSVEFKLQPALAAGHQLRVLLDGQAMLTSRQTSVVLNDVARGTHQLRAEIIDNEGRVRRSAGPITFHLLRHSILHRQ